MSEETKDPWREIVHEAITANSTQPIVGTHFRAAIDSAASKRGLRFPPSSEPELRLIQLIERYPDLVSLLRRPGQDFLVVPAGRSDLMTKGIQRLFIRQDLFQAFTTVSDKRLYYDKNEDRVVMQELEGQALPASWVAIDPTTELAEIQMRRDFMETLPEQSSLCSQLLDSLAKPLPLSVFGKTIREGGLQREWHNFRTQRVLQKIQCWARDRQVEWRESWITEGPTYYTKKNQVTVSSDSRRSTVGDSLQALFSGLDAADIQRISIPLDLVLKAISSSRKR